MSMSTILPRLSAVAVAAIVAAVPCAPAQAAVQTWYLSGYMDPLNGGSALDGRLEAAFASRSTFTGSFSFNTTATALDIIPGSRTDFVTNAARGGGTTLQTVHGAYATGSSRLITDYSFNGERLTLNANEVPQGPGVAGLDMVFLDLLVLNHFGPPSAPDDQKWPWFTPGHRPTQLPDLAGLPSDTQPMLVFGFFDSQTQQSVVRIGVVTGLSLTPPPVPEPGTYGLMAGGIALLAWLRRRSVTSA